MKDKDLQEFIEKLDKKLKAKGVMDNPDDSYDRGEYIQEVILCLYNFEKRADKHYKRTQELGRMMDKLEKSIQGAVKDVNTIGYSHYINMDFATGFKQAKEQALEILKKLPDKKRVKGE